ncbi:5-formyltetrahydrofolate cyclo-ligase [Hoeflea sp. AS16]|uniref:5-formyltetrahydrofolate cyclo-ligase n=1 Tax=Hoeflea sp. AS16 TaxID=3135779 RepID=UPI00317766F1
MRNEEELPHRPVDYASPPGFMPALVSGSDEAPSVPECRANVLRWRKAERRRLLDARLAISAEARKAKSDRIAARLDQAIGKVSGRTISCYWPIRGEPDLRNWAASIIARGGQIALPVVIKKGWPLEFRIWSPGDRLDRGIWNIIVPAGGPAVQPNVVVAPVIGFDEENYRLSYAGSVFDKTRATMKTRPVVIGVGYAESRIPTIHPLSHNIPMDIIVTDE